MNTPAPSTLLLARLAFVLISGFSTLVPGQIPPNDISTSARLDQRLNSQAPLELAFHDENARSVHLRHYFHGKPVILVLSYFECPNLCTLVLNALLNSVQDLKPGAGKDFEIVVVSFNPHDTPAMAAAKKLAYTRRYGRPDGPDGWHFLTGTEPAIAELARSAGFRYVFDPQSHQYAHPSAIMVLTPAGKFSRYFAGLEYPPGELASALLQASDRRIGSPTSQVFLFCFHYNPLTGKYGVIIMRVIRVAGLATAATLLVFMITMFRRDRRIPSHTARE